MNRIQGSYTRLQFYFKPLPLKMINLPRAEVPDSEPVSERSYGIIPIRVISTGPSPGPMSRKISTANTQVLLIQQRPVCGHILRSGLFPKVTQSVETLRKSILQSARWKRRRVLL